ncbi:hypothetical protein [Aurantimonas sp. 22II-16-19i]|uniref:hypothetical protein n=1 Tax=Aurantimonas sp. 22II-16-19i TaxID=1317114 RepID=UPI0009F7C5FD|nr:hypothetical protein [Aurantimonas sp. 22II-16-19i]ORE89908.1 hypothetical protein ATO4_22825 [Aurantimonas sp. 22II-16-19i]
MAEKQGFFRRIFSFGTASEEARTPEHGTTPRPTDTEFGREDAPDPDVRSNAAASSVADAEAGAIPSDEGGITPLKPRDDDATAAGDDEAQKKTSPSGTN